MAQEEQVLVVKRSVVEQVGMFQGLVFDPQRYLDEFFVRGVAFFMPRSQAETDPSHKQLIPYVIMTHGGKCLSYVRGKRAGETRLVGRKSVGIGGHVNPVDDMPLLYDDMRNAYFDAVKREVEEEVQLNAGYEDRVVALLNDDSTEVGMVHLGIVHHWALESPDVTRREQMITQLGFESPEELLADREGLETWSQLCLKRFEEVTRGTEACQRG